MQHVFEVSSALSLAATAERVGALGLTPADVALVVVAHEPVLEASVPLDARPENAEAIALVGRVIRLEALTAPAHPLAFAPEPDSHHERLAQAQLVAALGLDESTEHTLWIESVLVPGRTLARLLPRAVVRVLSTSALGYGPTPGHLDDTIAHRVAALHQLDLVPGLPVQLLAERGVPVERMALGDVVPVTAAAPATDAPVALILGTDYADQDALTEAEHGDLLDAMVTEALAAGAGPVFVRRHPRGTDAEILRVVDRHRAAGHDVRVAPEAALAEELLASLDVRLVVGVASTALLAARALGIPTLAVHTRWVLEHTRPYANPQRVPLALADVLLPTVQRDGERGTGHDVPFAAMALGLTAIAMQPAVASALQGVHDEALIASGPDGRWAVRHYVPKVRLDQIVPPPAEEHAPESLATRIGRRLKRS